MRRRKPQQRDLARVAIFAPLYPPAFLGGGPVRSLHALATSALSRASVLVITSDRDLGQAQKLDVNSNVWSKREGVDVLYISTDSVASLFKSWASVRKRKPTVIYLNSFFDPLFSIMPQLLYRIGWWGESPACWLHVGSSEKPRWQFGLERRPFT